MKKIFCIENAGCIILFICSVLIFGAAGYRLYKDNTITPVEEIITAEIDSITDANDSIKVIINNIDSIRNENIKKVNSLDDSANVELFKWLLSK